MDMWDPYVASTREHLDESEKKIVYDKYHIAAHLAKAVDQVRRAENKRLLALGDELSKNNLARLFSSHLSRQFSGGAARRGTASVRPVRISALKIGPVCNMIYVTGRIFMPRGVRSSWRLTT